jgi:hypothetical protein
MSYDAMILGFRRDWCGMSQYARREPDCLLLIPLSIPDSARAAVLGEKIVMQEGKAILVPASSKIWVGQEEGAPLGNSPSFFSERPGWIRCQP